MRFKDRFEAGNLLGEELKRRGYSQDSLVLGLPRGGVPVAFVVAQKLGATMDLYFVRKLGVPGNPELAMGAIGPNHAIVLDSGIVTTFGVSEASIKAIVERESKELERRLISYRKQRAPLALENKTVIVVDDGLATGASMLAACRSLKATNLKELHVAVPVAPKDSCERLKSVADEVIALRTPEPFNSVGQWYADFRQVTDVEVIKLMELSQLPPLSA